MMESREIRSFAYEIKFLIPAGQSEEIRAWARERLGPDPNAEGGGDIYRITSLYFDTPELGVFHRTGSHGRAKYRIRRYDASATVFVERKLRSRGVVTKRRTLVPVEDLRRLAEQDAGWRGNWFRRRVEARGMSPTCQISYLRTALVGSSDAGLIRLTMDEGLCAARVSGPAFRPIGACTALLPAESILEMKFRMAMPAAFKEIVQQFRLTAQPVSKYRLAVPVLGMAPELAPPIDDNEEPIAAYA
jgi:VTC domain